jgi:hypothetical protein
MIMLKKEKRKLRLPVAGSLRDPEIGGNGHFLIPRPYKPDDCTLQWKTCPETTYLETKKKDIELTITPWHESAGELYPPSDRRLSAKLVPTFCGYRVPRGQLDGSLRPYSRLSRPVTIGLEIKKKKKKRTQNMNSKLKTPWSESESELYRPNDRRLSAKWLSTCADRRCHVVSVTDPSGRILGFLDRSRYFSIK